MSEEDHCGTHCRDNRRNKEAGLRELCMTGAFGVGINILRFTLYHVNFIVENLRDISENTSENTEDSLSMKSSLTRYFYKDETCLMS